MDCMQNVQNFLTVATDSTVNTIAAIDAEAIARSIEQSKQATIHAAARRSSQNTSRSP